MSPDEIKSRFDDLAARLWKARVELVELSTLLSRTDDKKALRSILTDLAWATENCTVIGLHQVGQALHDNMGMGSSE